MASKNSKIFNLSHGLVLTFQPGANLKMVFELTQAGFQIDVREYVDNQSEVELKASVWKYA